MKMVNDIIIELEKAGYIIINENLIKNIPNDQMLGEEIRKLFTK